MERPRVLIVGNLASAWGGAPAVCEALASRLQSRGWALIATSRKRPRLRRLADMLATVWRRRRAYDVAMVEVFSGPAFIWAEAACHLLRTLKKPYVLALHGGGLPAFSLRSRRRVERLVKRAAAVVAQSDYLASAVSEYSPTVHLIPNAIDVAHCPFRVRDSPSPTLVWLRSFHKIYNPSLAVRVVALLVDEFPEMVLTMIGPDKGDGSLDETRTLAVALGVETNVRFQEAVPKQDVPIWLNRADVFLNTTNVDNTPVSVQEAMACGLCVATTDVGGIPYLVTDGSEGLLVRPGDAQAMAGAVRRVLTDPSLAAHISAAARRKVERMDWPVVVDKWEALLTAVAHTDIDMGDSA
ncbi:MAG: glycosyltransferase family 4 protein [Armatimonadetes bacterium]|nr:glycosyltransferase family 4 protein [Armatimonadota bacterium]